MYNKGDFHMHTNSSDGKYTPEELLKKAKKNGIDIIAITDHDTTSALEASILLSNRFETKVVPGIELSTIHNDESIHILGYFKDDSYKAKEFQKYINDISEFRLYRGAKIVENLQKYFNIKLNYKKVLESKGNVLARPHIAKAIIEAGYPYTWDYIFNNILSKESPAYVSNKKVSIPEGIKLLKSVNALVVLAHPVLIKHTNVEDLMKFDFDGLEAIYIQNTLKDELKYKDITFKHNKFITAGSDFHGLSSEDKSHGEIGSVYLEKKDLVRFLCELNID